MNAASRHAQVQENNVGIELGDQPNGIVRRSALGRDHFLSQRRIEMQHEGIALEAVAPRRSRNLPFRKSPTQTIRPHGQSSISPTPSRIWPLPPLYNLTSC